MYYTWSILEYSVSFEMFFLPPQRTISVQSQQQQNWNNIQGVGVVLLLLTFKHMFISLGFHERPFSDPIGVV